MTSYLLILALALGLAGCSDSDGGSTSVIPPDNGDKVEIAPPPTPEYPSKSTLKVTLIDASDSSALSDATVTIEGKIINGITSTMTTDDDGNVIFDLNQTQFTDLNLDGKADESKPAVIYISGTNLLSATKELLITDFGENLTAIRAVDLTTGEVEGISVTSRPETDLTTVEPDSVVDGVPVIEVVIEQTVTEDKAIPKVQIPLTSSFISEDGVALDITKLEVQIVEVDVNNDDVQSLLSVGTSSAIANPAALAEALDDFDSAEEAQDVSIAMMGTIIVNISDGNNTASSIVSKDPVLLTIPIGTGVTNADGELVTVGDEIALLSLSENQSAWNFEGIFTVEADETGNLVIKYPTTHFSTFGVGEIRQANCEATINILNEEGLAYSDAGVFRLQGEFINTDFAYNGGGRISYSKVADEPLTLIYTSVTGTSEIMTEGTTVAGSINNISSTITGLEPCSSDAETIVFKTIVKRKPMIHFHQAYGITEGTDNTMQVTLTDAPDTDVSFSIVTHGAAADRLSIVEAHTFTVGTTELTIPYSAAADGEITNTEYANFEFTDASGEAVFVDQYSQVHSDYNASVAIYNVDKLELASVTSVASEDSNKSVITFELNLPVPTGVRPYLYVRSNAQGSAAQMLDYDSKTTFYERGSYSNYYYVSFNENNTTATLTIPVVDDIDVEGDETFELAIVSSQIDVTAVPTTTVTITDNDILGDVNATNYSVEFVRFSNRSIPNDNSTWESERSWLKITLDKAALYAFDINSTATSTDNNDSRYSVGKGVRFNIGDATKYIEFTAINDYITNGDVDVNISLTKPADIHGATARKITVADDDYDYLYIYGPYSGDLVAEEGYTIRSDFSVYTNFSGVTVDTLIDGDGTDSKSLVFTNGGTSFQSGASFQDVDDTINKPARNYVATATLSGIVTDSESLVVYIAGSTGTDCYMYNPKQADIAACSTYTRNINVLDNDLFAFTIETPPSVAHDLAYDSTTTPETQVVLYLTSSGLNDDSSVSFDLQNGETVTLTKDEPRQPFTVTMEPISIEEHSSPFNYVVELTMTTESKETLDNAGLDYKLNTSVAIPVTYTIQPEPLPPVTGGTN